MNIKYKTAKLRVSLCYRKPTGSASSAGLGADPPCSAGQFCNKKITHFMHILAKIVILKQ